MRNYLLLLLIVFCFCINSAVSQNYDLFQWNTSIAQVSNIEIARFGPDDSLYIGSPNGLHVYKDNTITHYLFNPDASDLVRAIAFENNFQWIGTDNGLVKRSGSITVYKKSNSGIISNRIKDLFFSNQQLIVGTDSGISLYDGMTWTNFDLQSMNLTEEIMTVGRNNYGIYAIDKAGTIVVNSGSTWQTIRGTANYYIFETKFRALNSDTLLLPSLGAYLVDTVLKYVNVTVDPCLMKDILARENPVFYNNTNGETFFNCGFVNGNKPILIKGVFPDGNISDIRRLLNDPLDSAISEIAAADKVYDFNSSGKMFWLDRSGSSRKIYSVVLSLDSFAIEQPYNDCPYLDINQVRARIQNNGSLFWDQRGNALYEVPKGTGNTAIFSNGFWIGGMDDGANNLHIAAQTYRQSGSDFWPGPLDTINASIDSMTMMQYDKVWKINRSMITEFISEFAAGNVQNGTYIVPDIIVNWPAQGTGNYSRSLAPFIDFNNDGIYNPYDGDYPDIKGSQMIWWVFNDNYGIHGETNSQYNLGVEIRASAYAYNCPLAVNADSVINYTTFYHYDIINRSSSTYHDVYLGTFTDVDLGNYLDDYIGCDTVNNFGFGYNGDDNDEGYYGWHPPMIDNVILSGPDADLSDQRDNDHDGIIDEPGEKCMMTNFMYWNNDASFTGNPYGAGQYYSLLQSRWRDGTFLTYGGTGYDTASHDYTNFVFSGSPFSGALWTETNPAHGNVLPNVPSDRRFLSSSGPFTIQAGEMRSYDFAYVYSRDPNNINGPTTSVIKNLQDVQRIRQFYDNNSFPCDNVISVEEISNIQIGLYPNPASQYIEITFENSNGKKDLVITNAIGQEVFKNQITSEKNIRIATDRFAKGVYFVRVVLENRIGSAKFVIE